jgi:hypothetical protein
MLPQTVISCLTTSKSLEVYLFSIDIAAAPNRLGRSAALPPTIGRELPLMGAVVFSYSASNFHTTSDFLNRALLLTSER